MTRKVLKIFVAICVVGGFVWGTAGAVAAQGQSPEAQYKKETRYDFDDDVVEGELQRPEGDQIVASTKAKHSSLIQIRENFIPEILKSAEDI